MGKLFPTTQMILRPIRRTEAAPTLWSLRFYLKNVGAASGREDGSEMT